MHLVFNQLFLSNVNFFDLKHVSVKNIFFKNTKKSGYKRWLKN